MRLGRVTRLVALATGLGASVLGCGSAPPSGYGDLMLTVTVPGDVLVRSADYKIDDQTRTPLMGTIQAEAPVHRLDKLISHLPAGEYVVSAHAEATDHQSVCEASLSIRVSKGATARVELAPTCKGSGGQVVVGIGVDCHSTSLVDLLVSPLSARVGESVLGRATPARSDGGALSYAWSAPSGTFSDPKASQTMFTCAAPGPVEVTVQVTDDQACQQSNSAMVTCLPRPDGGADADGGKITADGGKDVDTGND